MKINNPTFGTDFEMFLKDKKDNFISAIGRIGGTKEEPLSIGERCFRQEDNVAAEFNIPPVNNKKDWEYYIDYCINKVQSDILDAQDLNLVAESAAYFSEEQLNHPKAQEFGCTPSFNAWSGSTYHIRKTENTIRTTGFHLHVGFNYDPEGDLTLQDVFELMKYFDLYLGVPSILIEPANARRELYGKAGDCRAKDIAEKNLLIVEYRTLGGYMLNYKGWVYDQMMKAIEAFEKKEELNPAIEDAINQSNIQLAKQIVKDYKIKLPEHVSSTVNA